MNEVFMIPDPESVDLSLKPNTGSNPVSLRDGYSVMGGGPARPRDGLMDPAQTPHNTENGGFLGRMEQESSESKDA